MEPSTVPGAGRLAGARAVITGGARGIGAGIARRFATEGASVTVLDRLVEQGRETARDVGGRFGAVDLVDPADTRDAVQRAVADLGGIDILVNSAGIFAKRALLDLSPDDWDQMMAVNARATLITMQTAAVSMIEQGSGVIINLSSMAAKKGAADEGHYAASKAAVLALTRAAALEWGPFGVRANAVCPGFVLTDMGSTTRTAEQVDEWASWSPLGRLGTTDDIAGVATFLASPDGSYLTGQAINVTGGMVMT